MKSFFRSTADFCYELTRVAGDAMTLAMDVLRSDAVPASSGYQNLKLWHANEDMDPALRTAAVGLRAWIDGDKCITPLYFSSVADFLDELAEGGEA